MKCVERVSGEKKKNGNVREREVVRKEYKIGGDVGKRGERIGKWKEKEKGGE